MTSSNRQLLVRALVIVCLLTLSAQLVLAIPRLSLTYDEPIYTGIGYADLTTRNYYWHGVIGHGPLASMLNAWPLLFGPYAFDVTKSPMWGTDNSLGFGQEVLASVGPLATTLFVTRYPATWLALILAAVVFRWTTDAWGQPSGLLALAFLALEPNLIAHGQLNTTDMSVTLFGFVSTYLLYRYLHHGGTCALVGTGAALGAAIASKTSGLFWFGAHSLIVAVFWLTTVRKNGHGVVRSAIGWVIRMVIIACIAVTVLWAAYGWEFGPIKPGGVPLPAPSHWLGLAYQRSNLTYGQTTFIGGRLYAGGHWSYFPLTLALKTPVPLLFGALLGLGVAVQRGIGESDLLLPYALTPTTYLLFSMLSGLNIGHRHLLPVLPYLVILAAQTGRRWGWLGGILVVWCAIDAVGVFPNYLTYFNILAGGPATGYRHFADSNTDWGQGFYALEAYLSELSKGRADTALTTYLAGFSSIDPEWYHLDYEPIPPTKGAPLVLPSRFAPEPGRYIISIVPLQGVWVLDPDMYDWFRREQPVSRIANVFNVYEVRRPSPVAYRAHQCGDPVAPLDRADLEEGFGQAISPNAILSTFDCKNGWLYPGSESWLILRNTALGDPWVMKRIDGISARFSQRDHWSHPAVTLFKPADRPSGSRPPNIETDLLPMLWTPGHVPNDRVRATSPINTSGPLTFLGYEVSLERDLMVVESFWQVIALVDRPLSLMAHLADGDGTTTAVADGLAVDINNWQPGDVIVQRHLFERPVSSDGSQYLLIGAYWLDTLDRWQMDCAETCTSMTLIIPVPIR